ncbi:MAG: hypothetical protein WAL40_06185 [Rhodoplanes sp.]
MTFETRLTPAMAARLRDLGIRRGDVVTIQLPNRIAFPVVFFALDSPPVGPGRARRHAAEHMFRRSRRSMI